MSTFTVDKFKLEDFSIGDKIQEAAPATFYQAKKKDSGQEFVCKVTPKSEKNDKAYEAEIKSLAAVGHPCIARLFHVVNEDEKHYLFFEALFANSIAVANFAKEGKLEKKDRNVRCIQFASFLDALHKKDIFYCRREVDNIWVNGDNQKLRVYGLDCCYEGSESPIYKYDSKVTAATDLVSLANFVAITAKKKYYDDPDLKKKEGKFFANCLEKDVEKRSKYNPREAKYFKAEINITTTDSSVSVNDFTVSWEEGLEISMGQVGFGFNDNPEVYLKIDDSTKLVLGADGIGLKADAYEILLGPEGLVFKGTWYDSALKLNTDGISLVAYDGWTYAPTITLGPNGYKYEDSRGSFLIGENGLEPSGFEISDLGMKFSPFTISVGKEYKLIMDSGSVQTNLDHCGFKMYKKGLKVSIEPMKLCIGDFGIKIKAPGFLFKNIEGGIRMEAGILSVVVANGQVELECDGYKMLCKDGETTFSNDNLELDWKDVFSHVPKVTIKVPGIPKIKLPDPPKIPTPGIPGMPDLGCCLLI